MTDKTFKNMRTMIDNFKAEFKAEYGYEPTVIIDLNEIFKRMK